MMTRLFLGTALAVGCLLAGGNGSARAQESYRPFYSPMSRGDGYLYRKCYYYSRQYNEYRYHVAVYHRAQLRYVYYYNPYKRLYWGRYDLIGGGYSKLAANDCKAKLGDIPEAAFPPPGQMPPAEDGGDPMLPPPESLPTNPGGLPSLPSGSPFISALESLSP